MIKTVLILVALSFVAWGGYRMREERLTRVATVNGESITAEEFNSAYRNLMEQLQQSFGNNLNEEMIRMLKVDRQALERLINQTILLQQARKLGIRVSESELAETIRKMPAFQKAGLFDPQRYRTMLSGAKLNPESFEALQKESMLIQKLNEFITASVKVSEAEALEWYRWQNAAVNIEFVHFNPEKYDGIEVAQEEVKKYFEKNQSAYKTEPKVKARYLVFAPGDSLPDVRITAEEVNDYYTANPEEFKTPKTVEARHVLIRVGPDASEEEVESARKRASDVTKLAREGKDFAELAKTYSEDPAKETGGYLGTFERNAMVEPFAAKAFSMKPAEISDPVRTQFGWHVIKVEKVNEASTIPENTAKEKIRKKLTEDKAKSLAYENAEKIYETIFDGDDLKKISEERNLSLKETDFFGKQGPEGIENRAAFAETAFKLSEMQISEIQDFGKGFYILQVVERVPEKIPEFESVQDVVRADLIREKQREKASAEAAEFIGLLKKGTPLAEAAGKNGLKTETTGFFKRNESIPNLGYEPEIASSAFNLSKAEKVSEKPIQGGNGFYAIRLQERKEPGTESFQKEKTKITESLLQLKQQKAFNAWLANARKDSEITVEKGLLREDGSGEDQGDRPIQ